MRIFLAILVLLVGLVAWITIPIQQMQDRIRGVCVVNPPRPITSTTLGEVKQVNAEWVAVIPYGFSRAGMPSVSFDHSRQWWGEQTDGNCMMIQYAKENGLRVMCKPHVWVRGQGWAGDFNLTTEQEWKVWEEDYTQYILNHARP